MFLFYFQVGILVCKIQTCGSLYTNFSPFKTQITCADSTLTIFLPYLHFSLNKNEYGHIINTSLMKAGILNPNICSHIATRLGIDCWYLDGCFQAPDQCKKWQGVLCLKQYNQSTSLRFHAFIPKPPPSLIRKSPHKWIDSIYI